MKGGRALPISFSNVSGSVNAITFRLEGEAYDRLAILAGGALQFGPGSSSYDIGIQRGTGPNGGAQGGSLKILCPATGGKGAVLELVPSDDLNPSGVIPSEILLYNVTGANYERAGIAWFSSEFIIDVDKAGTGTYRQLTIMTSAVPRAEWKASSGFVGNDSGADYDHRWEGDTDANLLCIDAGTDKVGIGMSGPSEKLGVTGNIALTGQIKIGTNPAQSGVIRLANNSGGLVARNAANDTDMILADLDASNGAYYGYQATASSIYAGTNNRMTVNATGIGFFAATPAAKQTSGENLTNNITSGGVDGTLTNWTNLSTYSTDAAAIRNCCYQLGRKLKQVNDALRLYGLLT